jgi:anhydro-N-acetylmuramic acid kinase
MIVAGVMSGTSGDGINVALLRVRGSGWGTRFRLLAHDGQAYPAAVRRFLLKTMNARRASVADLARLSFLLGELYAEAVQRAMRKAGLPRIHLVGCHGQTLYHQGDAARFLGRRVRATWQSGEGAVLAARLGVPVVSDFRPADLAAGGRGAPLVPFLDYLVYRDPRRGRIVQNLGGIANLTAIPAGASPQEIVAWDTGPGNMVIDALAERLYAKPMDRNGAIAARGRVLEAVLAEALRRPFFRRPPPKTAGREQFGREFVQWFRRRCGRARKEDMLATATALTARSIAQAVRRLSESGRYQDYIVSGGGVRNRTLMRMLRQDLEPLGLTVRTSDEFGLPSDAKEATAFALLAVQGWQRRPGNLPSATGARRPAILGKISHA